MNKYTLTELNAMIVETKNVMGNTKDSTQYMTAIGKLPALIALYIHKGGKKRTVRDSFFEVCGVNSRVMTKHINILLSYYKVTEAIRKLIKESGNPTSGHGKLNEIDKLVSQEIGSGMFNKIKCAEFDSQISVILEEVYGAYACKYAEDPEFGFSIRQAYYLTK